MQSTSLPPVQLTLALSYNPTTFLCEAGDGVADDHRVEIHVTVSKAAEIERGDPIALALHRHHLYILMKNLNRDTLRPALPFGPAAGRPARGP